MNLSILTKDEITKSDILNVAEVVSQEIEKGSMNPLEVQVRAKAMEELAKVLKNNCFSYAQDEFERYGKGEIVSFNGIELSMSSRSAGLNYEEDSEYLELKNALKERKELLDDSFKQFQKGHELVIDGEVIPVVSAKGGGSSFFKFKIK